jgi:DNA adenine methylase (dam)
MKLDVKPILKWAGGKRRLLPEIKKHVPERYGTYIEPFFGGGALFFNLQPKKAVIADSNPELINLYQMVASNVEGVIDLLKTYPNEKPFFYLLRSEDWTKMLPVEAAARTIYLNKTCFNGLYRVNHKGQFNTPFAFNKNPTICDEENLRAASKVLKGATIVFGDYIDVLRKYAKEGDFVFIDPPYIPVSEYADFKRYTKDQFRLEDHKRLASEIRRLDSIGCEVIATNSNSPLVYEIYSGYPIYAVNVARSISSKGTTRKSKDTILTVTQSGVFSGVKVAEQLKKFPATRYMGSKSKLIEEIWKAAAGMSFDSVLDLFGGSNVVGYMFKCHGKRVISNDYMHMSACNARAMIKNDDVGLSDAEIEALTRPNPHNDNFVSETFRNLYFSDEDNKLIDNIRANICDLNGQAKKDVAMAGLMRACMKKRPRGLFTFVGDRYNDGRRDLKLTFKEQFVLGVRAVNTAVFSNGKRCESCCKDATLLDCENVDLVYMDPPYYSKFSDNEYVRRYHFVEGLARDWKGVSIQQNTLTKKFKSYPTPFSTREGATKAFDGLFEKYKNSCLIISYSSNCFPEMNEMMELLKKNHHDVKVIPIDYRYSFKQDAKKVVRNEVQEYLFTALPGATK